MHNLALKIAPELVEVSRGELESFLRISRKGKQLVLATIGLEIVEGVLTLTCRDRKVSTKIRLGESGQKPNIAIAVLLKDLIEALKSAKKYPVFFRWNETFLTVYVEDRKVHIKAMEGFYLPFVSVNQFLLPSVTIRNIFPAMLNIVSDESPRAFGTVMNVKSNGDFLEFCATNGFVLAVAKTRNIPELAKSLHDTKIPSIGVDTILAMAKLGENISIGISEDKSFLTVEAGQMVAVIRTSNVRFPKYDEVIPKTTTGQIFNRKEVLEVLKMVTRQAGRTKALHLLPKKSGVQIHAQVNETSPVQEFFLETPVKLPFEIHLNGQYLVDCLSAGNDCSEGIICFGKDNSEPVKIILGSVETVLVPIKLQ